MTGKNTRLGGGGFHHVAMNVKDFDASVNFYTDGLGFTLARLWKSESGRGAMLDTGDGNYLEIFEKNVPGSKGTIIHYALRTSDCRAAHATALEAGGREKQAPTEITIPSQPEFPATISFVFGPDGEEIEFFQER